MKIGCAICSLWKKGARQGFFILELQISLFLTLLLLALVGSFLQLGMKGWNTLSAEAELRDCSRYIFSRMDKDIGLNAQHVEIKSNGALELQAMEKKHVIRLYCEKNRVYRRVLTRAGSAVNPLYINDVFVEEWRVRSISSKQLIISYVLKKGAQRQRFQQLIICHNGIIESNGG